LAAIYAKKTDIENGIFYIRQWMWGQEFLSNPFFKLKKEIHWQGVKLIFAQMDLKSKTRWHFGLFN